MGVITREKIPFWHSQPHGCCWPKLLLHSASLSGRGLQAMAVSACMSVSLSSAAHMRGNGNYRTNQRENLEQWWESWKSITRCGITMSL